MVALVLLEWRVLVLKVGVDCPQTLHEPGSSAAYSAQLDQAKALHQSAPLRSDLGDQEICCSKKNASFPLAQWSSTVLGSCAFRWLLTAVVA